MALGTIQRESMCVDDGGRAVRVCEWLGVMVSDCVARWVCVNM